MIETEGPAGKGRLTGRTVAVFGAGSSGLGWGNGKAAAVLYAREGARVACIDIDEGAASATAELILEAGGEAEGYQADVTSFKNVSNVVGSIVGRWGGIDVLHNNVGITKMGSVLDTDEESWRAVLDTNLTGAFLTCKAVLPSMIERGRGSIVNISSLASLQINTYPYVSYYAAKSGLNHFTRSIAVEYASRGIRANAVLPGVIHTPLIETQIAGQYRNRDEMIAARNAKSPMGRMGTAWEVASVAVFLASDEASYVTGVCIPVDGGKSCLGR